MNLNNLFEGAIDELEKRRIEDLEAKMDDYAARARQTKDPKVIAALRYDFAKAKAERDSYHYVKEEGTDTTAFDRKGNKVPVYIPTKDEDELEEHGGGGGGPAQWHAYVKAHRTDEWSNSAAGEPEQTNLTPVEMEAANPAQQAAIAIAKKKEQGVDEGWQDFNKVEPYAVCLAGKPIKKFDYYEDARRFHDNWKKKLYNQGEKEKADKITLMPLNLDEASMSWAADKPTGPKFGGYLKGTDPAPTEFSKKSVGGCEESAELDEMGYRDPGGFVNWARKQGPRFAGFLHDPEVWSAAQDAYDQEMAEAAPTNIPRNFVAKNAKSSGAGQHKDAKRAMKQGDVKHKAQRIPTDEEYKPVTRPVPQPKKLNPGWALDPTTKAELKRRKDVRNRVGVDEGEKVDRMVKHIAKSEKATGKSAKDAEAIAWATANKRGYLDNANKKKHANESMNFMEWAVSQGSRFANFANNPEVYAHAKEAYVAEGMSNALSNITRRIAQPVSANTIIKNREQKKDSLKRQHFSEEEEVNEDLMSLFGEAQNAYGIYQFLKANGLPVALFVAAVLTYGLHNALTTAEEDKNTFIKAAKAAWAKVDHGKVEKIVAWLNKKFTDGIEKMNLNDPLSYAPDLTEIKKGQKDSNGNTGCWDGYHAQGTKKGKNGGQVRNCVPNKSIEEDWQKANKKDKTDGMSQKAVNAYKREHPGSKLKTAVTTKPSKLKKGSKDSKRRSSYCARSKGQKDMHNIDCTKTPDKAICKARKRWNCESQEQFDAMLREAVEKGTLQPGQYYVWTVHFDDGTSKKIKVTKDTFDPKAYYAKKNQVVINVDYDWVAHNG